MTEAPQGEALDFERAEFDTAPAAVTCTVCKTAPDGSYYSVNGHSVCARCLEQLRAGQQGSFGKALALGTAAGAVGALAYYGISELTGYNLALITLVLGIMVGVAVRRGAGGSRHVSYRILAVVLAWAAMSATYVPMVAEGLRSAAAPEQAQTAQGAPGAAGMSDPGPALWVAAAVLALAMPFFMISAMEVLSLIIFAVGLFEAWRRSAPPPFVVEGPFALEASTAASAADVPAAPPP